MDKPFPIRIRTFLVPLAGVALYYSVQILAILPVKLIIPHADDIIARIGGDEFIALHVGLHMFFVALFMGIFLSIWLFAARRSVLPTIRRERLSVRKSLTILPIAMTMLALASFYMILIAQIALYIPQIDQLLKNYTVMSTLNTQNGYDTILYYVSVGVLIPVIEEIVFRGIILGEFLSTMRPAVAVIVSSLVFGGMHLQPIQIGYACVCGLILGFVYLYSNSIFLSIGVHCVFNVVGGVLQDVFSDNKPLLLIFFAIEIFFVAFGVIGFLFLKKGYSNKIIREG